MTALLVGMGLIMFMLGLIGEYLWRTFDEARRRPRYIIEERFPSLKTDLGSTRASRTDVEVLQKRTATTDNPGETKLSPESDRLA
jgi:hypothetical protein